MLTHSLIYAIFTWMKTYQSTTLQSWSQSVLNTAAQLDEQLMLYHVCWKWSFLFSSSASAAPNPVLNQHLPRLLFVRHNRKCSPDQTTSHLRVIFFFSGKRGGSTVMLIYPFSQPCLFFDTVQSKGHWKHKILTHHRKWAEGKRCSVALTLIPSEVRARGGVDVTGVTALRFLSGVVVPHLHLIDLNE